MSIPAAELQGLESAQMSLVYIRLHITQSTPSCHSPGVSPGAFTV